MKRTGFASLIISVFMSLTGCVGISKPFIKNYTDPYHKKVAKAGFTEKEIQIDSTRLCYTEGPDNGPPLVLLHAQLMDWFDYSRVLPILAKSYHVFVVDYNGHGKTIAPATTMNANAIGAILAVFLEKIVQEPAYISGNSSGGLLTVWLAANKPEWVKAILLEDPPLFASEYPRIKQTIAYKSFETSHTYIAEKSTEPFLNYWITHSAAFINRYAGKNATSKILAMAETYEKANPGKPVEIRFLPRIVRMMFRGLSLYDPAFGDAFYTGEWNKDFDHAAALQKIQCPVLLLQASFEINENGILNGAMTQQDADHAMALLKHGTYQFIKAKHVVHLDEPKRFIEIMNDFFLKKKG